MITVAISQFREHLQEYLINIHKGEKILVTSHGKGVALVSKPEIDIQDAKKKLLKIGKTAVIGDIVSPINEKWKANQ